MHLKCNWCWPVVVKSIFVIENAALLLSATVWMEVTWSPLGMQARDACSPISGICGADRSAVFATLGFSWLSGEASNTFWPRASIELTSASNLGSATAIGISLAFFGVCTLSVRRVKGFINFCMCPSRPSWGWSPLNVLDFTIWHFFCVCCFCRKS